MTSANPATDPEDAPPSPETTERAAGFRLPAELGMVTEIAGLCGLAFTRPILDSYGRAPEAFLARDASRLDVLLFGLAVALLPTLLLALVAAATNLGGQPVRRSVQIGLVGVLGGVVAWRFGTDLTDWGARLLLALAAVVAAGLGALRWRVPLTATYLRFLGAASVMFVLLFLLTSPSSDLVLKGTAATSSEDLTTAVLDGTEGDPPPIVTLVLDALPTEMLLDGEGNIDASLYPNLAELAGDSTWYRNYTTMSAWTFEALPTMFTGQLPTESDLPDGQSYPDNFFTLFADTHDVHAEEQISRFCPTSTCPRGSDSALGELLGDAAGWWTDGAEASAERGQILPGTLDPDRGAAFSEWVAGQDFAAGDPANGPSRPGLWFYHLVMPHEPWNVLPDGTRYDVVDEDIHGSFLQVWNEAGVDVGRQRQILQAVAADRMTGELLDELRQDGIYDDAMVVVVSDHGQAFTAGEPLRYVTDEQFDQVLWTPLIVKAPGQEEEVIDETNLQSVDLMPVLAETLGFGLPWESEGLSVTAAADQRDEGDKQLLFNEGHEIEAEEGSDLIDFDGLEGYSRVLESSALEVPGSGEMGIWRRTEHGDLLGRALPELDVAGSEVAGTLEVEELDRLEGQSGERPLLELIAETDLGADDVVALAVNEEVAAVVPTISLGTSDVVELDDEFDTGEMLLHALLHPDPFTLGEDNTVTAYSVSGAPGAETLTPLDVTPA